MRKQLTVGLAAEGPTDVRFLSSIIQRTFEDIAFECNSEIEIFPVQHIEKPSGNFIEVVKTYATSAHEQGIMVLCVHTDADRPNDDNAFNFKIQPAFDAVEAVAVDTICRNLVAVVPVQMLEAWMLSDKALLKEEIGTHKSNAELCIHRSAEAYSDPKQAIEQAISIARSELTQRRRRKLTIAELYLPIGQKISLDRLEQLPSYLKFKNAVRGAFRQLNYLT